MTSSFSFHKSKAPIIWAFIVVAILSILFYQVSQNKKSGFNSIIVAGIEAQNFDLYVDGKVVGKMKPSEELGNSSAYAWVNLSDGVHQIELKQGKEIRASKRATISGKAMIKLEVEK